MERYYEQKKARLKKKMIRIGISIAIPFLFIVIPMGMLFTMMGGGSEIIPSAADEVVEEYQRICTLMDLNWEEIMIYDMIKTENEFDVIGPGPTAMKFFELHYKEFEEVEHEHPVYEKDENGNLVFDDRGRPIKTGEYTYTYTIELVREGVLTEGAAFKYVTDRGYPIVSASKMDKFIDALTIINQDELIELDYQSKTLYDFRSEFTDEEQEWMDVLISENILIKAYGNYYKLPDYINVEASGFFAWPTPGNTVISDYFGWRTHPIYGNRNHHNGLDIVGDSPGACMGDPIISIADGVVLETRWSSTGWGNTILIEHTDSEGFKWTSRYAHLAQIDIQEDDIVEMGKVIGAIGTTGTSTGAHLHLEIRYEGNLVDPWQLLKRER